MNWTYIAGFFDGEGSITYNGKGFRITIPQTNEEVLLSIKKFTMKKKIQENLNSRLKTTTSITP